jgi:hypothetical protein
VRVRESRESARKRVRERERVLERECERERKSARQQFLAYSYLAHCIHDPRRERQRRHTTLGECRRHSRVDDLNEPLPKRRTKGRGRHMRRKKGRHTRRKKGRRMRRTKEGEGKTHHM